MDAKKIGRSIAFLRNYYGMTQRDLANQLGVTDKAVSRWERGQGVPDISLISKLSIILDIDIESVLEGNLTQLELKWKGLLIMNYSDGIYADTKIFNKCSVYFQLSFFLLAGIKDICIRGTERDVAFVQNELGNGQSLGITLKYDTVRAGGAVLTGTVLSDMFKGIHQTDGIMMIDGLDFLYGKDITKYFRRVIYDCRVPVRLVSYQKHPTSISFYPNTLEYGKQSIKIKTQALDRGIITFPIKTSEDLLDAANLIRILEAHQGEKIANLEEIAIRRTLVQGKEIKQL